MQKSSKKTIWSKDTPPAKDIDAFIAASPSQTQEKLKQIRSIVTSLAPDAEEKISYKMPVYKYHGKWLVGFAGFQKHVSLFGMTGRFFEYFDKEVLKEYTTSKGTIQFPLNKPLPIGLIKNLINARMKELQAESKS